MRSPRCALLVTAPALLVALGLGACAPSGSEAGGWVSYRPASGAPSAEGFPVTVEHVHGTTTVPEEPQRVVSVGFTDQDTLLALGVTPVGVRDWYGDQPDAVWPWARDELGDAEPTVLSSAELDVEAVAALRPDLVVGLSSGMTAEEYDLLSQIAPTVAQSADFPAFGMPWQEKTLLTGRALGRTAQAEQVVAETEALVAAAREEHPEFEGETAAVAYLFDSQPGAYASADSRARLMSDLGFRTPPEFDELAGDDFFFSLSAEQVTTLDTDVLVWIVSSEAEAAAIAGLPTRSSLRAVQEGREVLTDAELSGALSFASPLSLPYVVRELVPELALAVDGDPATEVPSAAVLTP